MVNRISILIVDDDPGMTETLIDIFDEIGYEVDVAGDGYSAIEMIKEKAYNFSLIDIMMPGINGVEVFKELKCISPKTIVMMMTAYSVEELEKEALKEGAHGILHKPLDVERILNFIRKTERGFL